MTKWLQNIREYLELFKDMYNRLGKLERELVEIHSKIDALLAALPGPDKSPPVE